MNTYYVVVTKHINESPVRHYVGESKADAAKGINQVTIERMVPPAVAVLYLVDHDSGTTLDGKVVYRNGRFVQ